MMQRITRLAAALTTLLAAVVVPFAIARASDDPEEEGAEALRLLEEEVLLTLSSGSPDERLAAAESIPYTLQLGILVELDSSRLLDDLVDGLILVLHQEPDDWIARALLDALLWDRNPAMNRLFREALRSRSINVQAMGIRHFTLREDGEAIDSLERLWERDLPSWVRADLIEALAEQRSAMHLEDFMRLTRDAETEVRKAAIEALDTLAPPEAIPVLVRVARDGTSEDRATALEALGAFPDSDEALEEVLRASRSGDQYNLRATVEALGRFGHPDGDDRLIELLDTPPDPDLRAAIAEALQDSTHPDATAALVRLLHQRDVDTGSWIARTAWRVLHNRDDAGAVPGLLDLALDPGAKQWNGIGALITYLSRDRAVVGQSQILTSHCSSGAPLLGNPHAWHVVPLPPLETIRCWDGPDRAGDPEDRPRIPAGTLVLVEDNFEAPGGPWAQIDGPGADDCWVPLDVLDEGSGPPEPMDWPRRHLRHEFDIWADELESRRANRLSEAGLLDVFDRGDQIAGVALEVDALDADQVDLVRALLTGDDMVLDDALRLVLRLSDPEIVTDE